MVRTAGVDHKGPVDLLNQNQPHQLVGHGQLAETEEVVGPLVDRVTGPQASPDHESNVGMPVGPQVLQFLGELFTSPLFALNGRT